MGTVKKYKVKEKNILKLKEYLTKLTKEYKDYYPMFEIVLVKADGTELI